MYKKIHSISVSEIQKCSAGKFVNIISNDLNELDNGFALSTNVVLVAPLI